MIEPSQESVRGDYDGRLLGFVASVAVGFHAETVRRGSLQMFALQRAACDEISAMCGRCVRTEAAE